MQGWSDRFGAPPRALTDEELLRAVQPLPLRPLDIAQEAPASLGTANPFGQGPASPATTYSSDNYGAPLSIPFDQLMASLSPPPLRPLNYAGAPNNADLNPSDDWQKRGRQTAAMALSVLYPQNGPMLVAANQPPNAGGGFQPFPPGPIRAGVQPIALSTTVGAPRNAPGQAQATRALSQMRTDPAWQQDMKDRANEDFVPWMYDATRKGDYTIGYGHKITSQPEFSDYLGKTISRSEGEALFQRDLATAEDAVRRNVIQPLTQNQFDALVDFAFQAGEGNFTKSDIYTYANLGDFPAAERSFANTNAGTTGAYNRRVREAKKFSAP